MPRQAKESAFQFQRLMLTGILAFAALAASCGGKNIGQELDDLQGRISSTAGQLGSTAGLTELQLLDTLTMKVQELRVEWKDTLGDSLTSLDLEQQKTLDTLSQAVGKVDTLVDHTTRLEDLAVLDVNVLLSKAGLAPSNEIRRVVPSAQAHKDSGIYSYEVTLPLFGTGNEITGVRLNGADVLKWKKDVPPHGFRLDIPAGLIESSFSDWDLAKGQLQIDLKTPEPWWRLWKSSLKQTVTIDTGLFPRHPLRYWFASHPHHYEIDRDPAHLEKVNSAPTMIPGCGVSGCQWFFNICAAAPVGAEPVGDLFEQHDSFNGWGEFHPPPTVQANVTCIVYRQNSHNQNRTVWFSTHYRPVKDVTETHYYTLLPLSAQDAPAGDAPASPSQMVPLSKSTAPPSGVSETGNGGGPPTPNPTYAPPNGDAGPSPRALDLGRTYILQIDREVNWELVVQAFSGETITLSPTVLAPLQGSPKVIAARTEPGRLRIDTTSPY
jgi:hypothetical protein